MTRQSDTTPGSNWNIGRIELSEKCLILFIFKIITKYFQYENFLFYLDPIPIYKTGLKEPVETRIAVDLLVKNELYGISSLQDKPTLY